MPLPAISICNLNRVRKTKVDQGGVEFSSTVDQTARNLADSLGGTEPTAEDSMLREEEEADNSDGQEQQRSKRDASDIASEGLYGRYHWYPVQRR